MADMKWYAIHTYAGYENRVKSTIENAVQSKNLEDQVGRVLVPTEEVAEIRDGKKRVATRKIMPGYVLIEIAVNEVLGISSDIVQLVRETPNVSGFVGPGKEPTALTDDEVNNILGLMDQSGAGPRPKISFTTGDRVKVTDGPFLNFAGTVSAVNDERGRLTVMIEVLGRSTPVDLDFLQVERTTN